MCEIGKDFKNLSSYNLEMSKGMEDKLFFLNKLPKSETGYCFVDFGCADGAMINALTSICDIEKDFFIGYDISETMINLARSNYHGPSKAKVRFYSDWHNIFPGILGQPQKTVLILSSVIHEVYSYGTDESIKEFWNQVTNSTFDYIVIRDMCPSNTLTNDKEISHELHDKLIYNHGSEYDYQMETFEKKFGSLWYERNMYHFLLKYRWKVNWERECNENYFPINYQDILENMKHTPQHYKYDLNYFERFRVPFLDKCIKEDIGIELDQYTHIKAIFSGSFIKVNE